MKFRNSVVAASLSAVLMLGVAACGASSEGAAKGDNTFTVWWYEKPDSAMGVAWAAALEIFKEENPDVTVTFEQKSFDQVRETAGMALTTDAAPDLMEYNKGNTNIGRLAADGLIDDLSDVVKERGWDTKIPETLQATAKYTDGRMAGDQWYGVPNYGEFVPVYFNKALLEENGIAVPTTFQEFENALAQFKEKGITPLAVSGAEFPTQQLWYQVALTEADQAWINNYQLYEGDFSFVDGAAKYGLDKISEWVEKGYINSAASSLKAEDVGTEFARGETPFAYQGVSWFGRFMKEDLDFEWSVIPFPGASNFVGSSGHLWTVPSGSKNKDLAHEFIDITMRPEIQAILGNNGGLPVAADPADLTDPKSSEMIGAFEAVISDGNLAFYPDWPVPGFYDELVSAGQSLLNGSKSSAEVGADLDKKYQAGLVELGIK